jgi:hypothetical protein
MRVVLRTVLERCSLRTDRAGAEKGRGRHITLVPARGTRGHGRCLSEGRQPQPVLLPQLEHV